MILIIVFVQGESYSQDLTYKSDGKILNINIISLENGTIIYYLPGDTTGKTFYLSTDMVDSIKYRDGQFMIFTAEDMVPETIKRNYLGIDFFESFLQWEEDFRLGINNLHLSYEHISKSGKTGFTFELLWELHSYNQAWADQWDGKWVFWDEMHLSYDPFRFFIKTGLTTYPFNYSLKKTGNVRFSTGVSLLLGSINKYQWDPYYYGEYQPQEVFIAGIIANFDWKIYLADFMQIKMGVDASVIPFLVFFSPELGFTLSF